MINKTKAGTFRKGDLLSVSREEGVSNCFLNNSLEYELYYSDFQYRRLCEIMSMVFATNINQGDLLDIGTTPFTFLLKKITPHDIHTIDYTSNFAERCQNKHIKFENHDLTSQSLPFSGKKFDIIVFTEVFEHLLANPVRILSKIRSMLKDDGYLIFGTPNLSSLQKRILLAFNQPILDWPTWELADDDIHGHGHNRIYVRKELEDFMEKAGLNVTKVEYSMSLDYPEKEAGLYFNMAKLLLMFPKLLVPSFRWGIHMTVKPR